MRVTFITEMSKATEKAKKAKGVVSSLMSYLLKLKYAFDVSDREFYEKHWIKEMNNFRKTIRKACSSKDSTLQKLEEMKNSSYKNALDDFKDSIDQKTAQGYPLFPDFRKISFLKNQKSPWTVKELISDTSYEDLIKKLK